MEITIFLASHYKIIATSIATIKLSFFFAKRSEHSFFLKILGVTNNIRPIPGTPQRQSRTNNCSNGQFRGDPASLGHRQPQAQQVPADIGFAVKAGGLHGCSKIIAAQLPAGYSVRPVRTQIPAPVSDASASGVLTPVRFAIAARSVCIALAKIHHGWKCAAGTGCKYRVNGRVHEDVCAVGQ